MAAVTVCSDLGAQEEEICHSFHFFPFYLLCSNGAPGDGDGQGGLACCSPWGCKESDTAEGLKWIELSVCFHFTLRTSHSPLPPAPAPPRVPKTVLYVCVLLLPARGFITTEPPGKPLKG